MGLILFKFCLYNSNNSRFYHYENSYVSGQGSQSVGMGVDLYKNFDLVKNIFKRLIKKLNYPISKIILEGPDSELKAY